MRVLQPEGVRVQLQVADFLYSVRAPENTLTPPDDVSIWSPGNQDVWIRYRLNGKYLAGLSGSAQLQAFLTFPRCKSGFSFRLKLPPLWNGNGRKFSGFQFGGASTTDGLNLFQQNQPYFTESTVQVTSPAANVRTTYTVNWYSYDLTNPLTGFRLRLKGDPHLPSSGPGCGENGYFAIDEVAIVDRTGPPPSLQVPGSLQGRQRSSGGVPFRLNFVNQTTMVVGFDPGYQTGVRGYPRGNSGTSLTHLARTTSYWLDLPGIDRDTPYWVRVTTVNGSSDTDTQRLFLREVFR